MPNKERTITGVNVRAISNFIVLASVAMFLPFFIHLQWLSGPIVNAVLIITLFLVGVRSALLLCVVPSLMALSGGLLPLALAPAIPFIMLSNMLYVLSMDFVFQNIKDDTRGFFVGAFVGSMVKFLFLYFTVSLVSDFFSNADVALKIAKIFSYPQFFTAFSGAMIAWIVLKVLKRL